MQLQQLLEAMIAYMGGDARRIQHFIKVHALAQLIGRQEQLNERMQFILEAAALTHDIGIKNGGAKFGAGKCSGKTQELEGPPAAAELLAKLGFAPDVCERVCYLIGHHHTYTNIDGMDYQILVEADFLVNFYEDGMSKEAIQTACGRIFKTASGIRLCRQMFGI